MRRLEVDVLAERDKKAGTVLKKSDIAQKIKQNSFSLQEFKNRLISYL